ncbi:MAG: hypothetical protein U0X73_04665 [Thermoanaerobaculia bacterium]
MIGWRAAARAALAALVAIAAIAALATLARASALAAASAEPAAPAAADLRRLAPGELHPGVATLADPEITYELYLPPAFDPAKRWPLLFVFDPRRRGRFAAELFQGAAARWGWIVASSNDTLSDGPIEPNLRAVNAMYPDLLRRLPVDPRRVYATGFSGGAILAWILGIKTGDLAGVISVGGRMPDGFEGAPPSFALWAAAGREDFNHDATKRLDEAAAKAGKPHRLEIFPGPHSWFTAGEVERALGWLELVAMRDGSRPVDPETVTTLLAADLEGAAALASAGDALGALRRYRAIAAGYAGLADVAAAEREAARLAGDPATARAEKDEAWGESFEIGARRRVGAAAGALASEAAVPAHARLVGLVDVAGLHRAAALPGARGEAGRRALASARSQFAFYLVQRFFASRDWARARAALEVAVEIDPTNGVAWYNLACARARSGAAATAVQALARAAELGAVDWSQADEDADLESLRARADFRELRTRAAPAPAAGP